MRVVGIKELKARLSEYVRAVKAGETVLVTERDEVVAEQRPVSRRPARRRGWRTLPVSWTGSGRGARSGRCRIPLATWPPRSLRTSRCARSTRFTWRRTCWPGGVSGAIDLLTADHRLREVAAAA
jgi:antitoxin (DNA-binding transcriptional repressor) of toxin-antitoxin stability system